MKMKIILSLATALLITQIATAQLGNIFKKKKNKTETASDSVNDGNAGKKKGSFINNVFGKKEGNAQQDSLLKAGLTYADFKDRYKPHFQTPYAHIRGVKLAGTMEAKYLASTITGYVNSGDAENVNRHLSSIDRYKMGEILNQLKPDVLVKCLNMMEGEWAIELIWFANEKTYKNAVIGVEKIRNY
ncbi:MAG: hypothetical protein RLY16_2588 [Bacteroidota bacterium]|jgi:hypothetical protein